MATAVSTNAMLPASLCVAVAALACLLYQSRRRKNVAIQEGGTIKKILIYPFKSLPPVEVTSAELTIDGVSYKNLKDREFILLDAEKTFVTARGEPSLLLLETRYNEAENCVEITSNNPDRPMELLKVTLDKPSHGEQQTVQFTTWQKGHPYNASYCDEAVSEWFSRYLRKKTSAVRLISLVGKRHFIAPDRFQDAAELNILSDRSVDNLVDLLRNAESDNISYRNFRPSLLVETKYPFEEDFWAKTYIGDAQTQFHTRCDRCLLTTINPDSGVKTDKEPLVTLRKFRVDRSKEGISKYQMKPLLSCNHMINKSGTVHVGQKILVEKAARELL